MPMALQRREGVRAEMTRLWDGTAAARALVQLSSRAVVQLRARPRAETAVKASGGAVAALLAIKYAKSLRSACVVGVLAGVFAHSLYADVIAKTPPGAAGLGVGVGVKISVTPEMEIDIDSAANSDRQDDEEEDADSASDLDIVY